MVNHDGIYGSKAGEGFFGVPMSGLFYYPTALMGSGVLLSPEREGRWHGIQAPLAKVTKCGTHLELNMLINISSEFYHKHKKKFLAKLLHILHIEKTISALKTTIFRRSFSNVAKTFIVLRPEMSSIMEVLPPYTLRNKVRWGAYIGFTLSVCLPVR